MTAVMPISHITCDDQMRSTKTAAFVNHKASVALEEEFGEIQLHPEQDSVLVFGIGIGTSWGWSAWKSGLIFFVVAQFASPAVGPQGSLSPHSPCLATSLSLLLEDSSTPGFLDLTCFHLVSISRWCSKDLMLQSTRRIQMCVSSFSRSHSFDLPCSQQWRQISLNLTELSSLHSLEWNTGSQLPH